MLIDSHAHLNFGELLTDIEGVLDRAKVAGVEKIINIGTSLEDSKVAIELAQKYENLYATVGIHPENTCADWNEFERLAKSPKVVAIGECGLDYFKIQDLRLKTQEITRQKIIFEKQIEIAKKLNLPLVIHMRDSQEEMAKIDLTNNRGVFHCFSGGIEVQSNFYISFAGNITFKNAHNLREIAKLVPLEKLLVETDCPFLAPDPLRGSRNEPENVKITVSKLAELNNISLDELSGVTSANAINLFKI